MQNSEIFTLFLTSLLAVCTFFLTQFYYMVKDMVKDIKQIMISDARTEKRIETLEEEVREIKNDLKTIKPNYRKN